MDEAKKHFQASETERILTIKQKFGSFLAEKLGFHENDVRIDYGAAFPYTLDIPWPRGYKIREEAIQKLRETIDQFMDSSSEDAEHYSEWNESIIEYSRLCNIDGISTTVTISKFSEDRVIIRMVKE